MTNTIQLWPSVSKRNTKLGRWLPELSLWVTLLDKLRLENLVQDFVQWRRIRLSSLVQPKHAIPTLVYKKIKLVPIFLRYRHTVGTQVVSVVYTEYQLSD